MNHRGDVWQLSRAQAAGACAPAVRCSAMSPFMRYTAHLQNERICAPSYNTSNNKATAGILFTAAITAVCAHGAQRFAAPNGAHISPCDSWAKAATNMQSVVNAAANTDVVMLSDGLYRNATHILVRIPLPGLNGVSATVIAGIFPTSSNRCVYLAHPQAVLDGITVSNGAAFNEDEEDDDEFAFGNGGGVCCTGGKVQNCVVAKCQALYAGGGMFTSDTLVSNGGVASNDDAENDTHCGASMCFGVMCHSTADVGALRVRTRDHTGSDSGDSVFADQMMMGYDDKNLPVMTGTYVTINSLS